MIFEGKEDRTECISDDNLSFVQYNEDNLQSHTYLQKIMFCGKNALNALQWNCGIWKAFVEFFRNVENTKYPQQGVLKN